jgi:hypothetical protein
LTPSGALLSPAPHSYDSNVKTDVTNVLLWGQFEEEQLKTSYTGGE